MNIQALDGPQSIPKEWIVLFKGLLLVPVVLGFSDSTSPQQASQSSLDGPQKKPPNSGFFLCL